MKVASRPPGVTKISAGQTASPARYIREAWSRRGLVLVLSGRELKSTYEMNLVGFTWWLLEPLSLTLVYVVLFSYILKTAEPAYPLFVLVALLSFKWLSSALIGAMSTVRKNATLVTDLYFPRALLPFSEVVTELAHFMVGLIIIPFFMIGYGITPSLDLLFLPLVIVVQFVLTLGIAYPLSAWGVNYRNLPGLVGNLLRLWLYLSPALWSLELRVDNPTHRFLVRLNPLTGIFQSYRGAIGLTPTPSGKSVTHAAPTWDLAYSAVFGVVALVLGAWYFIRRESQFGKMI